MPTMLIRKKYIKVFFYKIGIVFLLQSCKKDCKGLEGARVATVFVSVLPSKDTIFVNDTVKIFYRIPFKTIDNQRFEEINTEKLRIGEIKTMPLLLDWQDNNFVGYDLDVYDLIQNEGATWFKMGATFISSFQKQNDAHVLSFYITPRKKGILSLIPSKANSDFVDRCGSVTFVPSFVNLSLKQHLLSDFYIRNGIVNYSINDNSIVFVIK